MAKLQTLLQLPKMLVTRHWRLVLILAGLGVAGVIALVVVCHMIISSNSKYVLADDSKQQERVGLVLGAGVNKRTGKPYKELQARLDVAAEGMRTGQVKELLLSGDNRFTSYDEPTAMKKYLVDVKKIPASKLHLDFAGRSTYESCERASKIFGVKRLIIYSAPTHLPRAIWLCRHFDIEAYGVSSGVDANNGQRRELQANVKAIFNVYFVGEETILGKPEKI